MKTDSAALRTLVRRYKGKHAAQHFRRHAAYMAKRDWVVMGTTNLDEQGVVVTYAHRPLPDPSSGAAAGARDSP